MATKKNYFVFLLFLIAIVGISNLTYEPRYAPKEDVVKADNQLNHKRQEKIVRTMAASFYFRQ